MCDGFINDLRRAGFLLEFTDEGCAAYIRKHFGPGSNFFAADSPAADPKDTAWADPHCVEGGNYYEPNPYK